MAEPGLIDIVRGAFRLALAPARFVLDRIAMLFAGPLRDLGPLEGAIVDLDGEKLAAYRDEDGEVHALSPICTHLRCVVGFNPSSGPGTVPATAPGSQSTGR